MQEHQRVVVHIDDPALRRRPLGGFVGVVEGGQPGADIQELADARLGGQMGAHWPNLPNWRTCAHQYTTDHGLFSVPNRQGRTENGR